MKGLTIISTLLLGLGHLLTEAGSLSWITSDRKPVYVHPFLSPYYKWYDPKGIDVHWFIKYVTTDLLFCMTFFVLTKIAYRFSFRLFLIGFVWFLYHCLDLFMLWWDFKTSYWLYLAVYVAIIATIISLFVPDKKTGFIKSIK